jgi:hypothetical protein
MLMFVAAGAMLAGCSGQVASSPPTASVSTSSERPMACDLLDDWTQVLHQLRYSPQQPGLLQEERDLRSKLLNESPEPMRSYVRELDDAMREIPMNEDRALSAARTTGFDEYGTCGD